MVLAQPISTTQPTDLADACATAFRRFSSTVVTTSIAELSGTLAPGKIVVAADIGVADCFVDVDDMPRAIGALEILDGRSIALNVVVPVHKMGEAHRALRGAPVRIQPYWYVGDDLCFGTPELP